MEDSIGTNPYGIFHALNSACLYIETLTLSFSDTYARSVHARPVHIRASAIGVRPGASSIGAPCDAPRRGSGGPCGRSEGLDGATERDPPRRRQSGRERALRGL